MSSIIPDQGSSGGGAQEGKLTGLSPPPRRKTDVFDSQNFDAVKFINQLYPDEASMGDLDKFTAMLRKQVKAVDREVCAAVRIQSGSSARSREDLAVATGQIGELFGKVRHIQRQAEDTELLVTEICRDIRKLDRAKRHLTTTITSLRRLAMLTAAVDDLEAVGHRRDHYRRCANLLEAVAQLMEHFAEYSHVPKIQSLSRRLAGVQRALQESVLDDFKLLLGGSADARPSADNMERLAAGCLVVNALGPKVRDALMDWLADREMSVYQTIFSMSSDTASLDRFERRFAWFKGRLEERKEVWELFPPAWRVPHTLCLTFCKITKASLSRILSDSEDAVRADVGPLLKAVVATNKFEREVAAMFGGGAAADEPDGDLQEADSLPASEARRRLEAFRKKQQAAKAAAEERAAATDADAAPPPPSAAAAAAARGAFEGAISSAFEGALQHYVAQEQRELMAHMEALVREEYERRWVPANADEYGDSARVLSSANQLFLKVRASLQRCVKLVSKGRTLVALAAAFQRVLSAYAAELLRRLPKTATGATSAPGPFPVGGDWHVRMSDEDEGVVCVILATAEYCRDTTEGLAAAIAKDAAPGLADQVDMSDQEGAFLNVSSQALSVLVLGLHTRLDTSLAEMLRMRWDAVETPGDDSPFVGLFRRVLVEAAPRLGTGLDRPHFAFLCDKVARMSVARYTDCVYRLRRVSDKGTIQLSIDTDSVRRALLDFPRAARPLDEEGDWASYAAYVEREVGGVINLVKVLQAKPENLVDTYILLMPPHTRSPHDFLRLCELKGFHKKLQAELLAHFQRRVGSLPDTLAPPSGGGASGAPGGVPAPAGTPTAPAGAPPPSLMPAAGGSGSVTSAASNLNAFKASMGTFTQGLASSFTAGSGSGVAPPGAASGGSVAGAMPAQGGPGAKPTLFKAAGLGVSFTQQAARTREGLAKMTASILRPNEASSGGGGGGGGGW